MEKNGKVKIEDITGDTKDNMNFSFGETMRLPTRFKQLNHLVYRNLNGRSTDISPHLYTKAEILEFLKAPDKNEKPIRDACINAYQTSPHFRRLVEYFVMLSDLVYVVAPYATDITKLKEKTVMNSFNKVLRTMEQFQVKSQFRKIIEVCMREDVFYGTLWVTTDNITIQRLPSDYCRISSSEGNVFNVSFDMMYFQMYPERLEYFPAEFDSKYKQYRDGKLERWVELDSPNSFAIKATESIDAFALPPFAGLLPEIYDLEDYKSLKLTRTELENYAILVMKMMMNNDGRFLLDFDRSKQFWQNLDNVLPDAVGSVLTPFSVDKISFDRSAAAEANAVNDATSALWDSAGVSALIFNNVKSSSNALALSIKSDQGITFGIVKSIENMVNRYIQSTSFGKNFKVTFLDVSPYNRDEIGGQYLKMCNVGMPMVSYLAATYGMPQSDLNNMNCLEDDFLHIKERFMPLRSTNTMSAEAVEAGRPTAEAGELSDNGEIARERDEE